MCGKFGKCTDIGPLMRPRILKFSVPRVLYDLRHIFSINYMQNIYYKQVHIHDAYLLHISCLCTETCSRHT